jgi:hypothetical protein
MINNTREKRKELIKKIEDLRQSKVIVYITGNRMTQKTVNPSMLFTNVALDVFPILHQHLRKIQDTEKIDLFLYTIGGMLDAPWPIVNLIRFHCNKFSVLVPFNALSAGTLITLGADEVVMTKTALLSPIDPTKGFVIPGKGVKELSVEDVIGFIELAKQKVDIPEEKNEEILRLLVQEVSPTELGSVNRTHAYIRDLARKLLSLHLDSNNLEIRKKIDKIVNYLTQDLYSHDYLINRKEAKEAIGLPILYADLIEKEGNNLETLMWELFNVYSKELELDEPFMPTLFLEDKSEKEVIFKRAYIETSDLTHIYESEFKVFSTPEGLRIDEKKGKWEKKEGD